MQTQLTTLLTVQKLYFTAGSDELLASMKLDGNDFNAGTGGQSIALIPRVGGATASPVPGAGEANPL